MSATRSPPSPGMDSARLVFGACGALLIACVIISSRKYYWHDELYSWYPLADASFSSMWQAYRDQLNVSPPLYFVLGWAWARLFGVSELALRMFSSLGICSALGVAWVGLSRIFPSRAAAIGVLTVFMTSGLVLTQNAEARMYGLFLALSAAAVFQYADTYSRRYDHTDYKRFILIAATHAALINTHLFGALYSVAVLGAFLISDAVLKRPKKAVYGTIVASWLLWLIYLPAFLSQSEVVRPRGWLPKPHLLDMLGLLGSARASFVNGAFVAVLVAAAAIVRVLTRNRAAVPPVRKVKARRESELPMLILAFCLLLPVLVTWVISRFMKPVFWDRYLIPSLFSYAIVIAYLCSRYLPSPLTRNSQLDTTSGKRMYLAQTVLWIYCGSLLVYPVANALAFPKQTAPGAHDVQFGFADLPIVVQAPGEFLKRWQYSAIPARYYYILDREAADQLASGPFGLQAFKHMEAFRRNYREFEEHIIESEAFLRKFRRFLIVDEADYAKPCAATITGLEYAREWSEIHCPQWVEKRLLSSPDYSVTQLGITSEWQSVLLVERSAALAESGMSNAAM